MAGVKGRSGTGSKTDEHRRKIRAGAKAYWRTPAGLERRRIMVEAQREVRRRLNRGEGEDE